MKKLALALVLFPMFAASASELDPSVEVLHELWHASPRQSDVWMCMRSAYRAETEAMERTADPSVRVRESRVLRMPDGLVFCFVRYYSSEQTEFAMETQTFGEKKCGPHAREISARKDVFWTDFQNRVRMPDGTRACKVRFLLAKKITAAE